MALAPSEPTAPAQAQASASDQTLPEVHVATSAALRDAIGSNRRLVLAAGAKLRLDDTLVIEGVSNLEITSADPATAASILVTTGQGHVMVIEESSRIRLASLVLGHETLEGCEAHVLSMDRVADVTLDGVQLFGSGETCLLVSRARQVRVDGGAMYGCQLHAVEVGNSNDVALTDVHIHHNEVLHWLVGIHRSNAVRFISCLIEKNTSWQDASAEGSWMVDLHRSSVELRDCTVRANTFKKLAEPSGSVSVVGGTFENNSFPR